MQGIRSAGCFGVGVAIVLNVSCDFEGDILSMDKEGESGFC